MLFVFYFCEITNQTKIQALTCTGLVKVGFLPCPIDSVGIFFRPLVSHGSADTLVSKIRSLALHHSSLQNEGLNHSPRAQKFSLSSQPQPISSPNPPHPNSLSFCAICCLSKLQCVEFLLSIVCGTFS